LAWTKTSLPFGLLAGFSCRKAGPGWTKLPSTPRRALDTLGWNMAVQVAVAGAGLAGATLARLLAEAGLRVVVFEARAHVAGNCHTAVDPGTGVLVHEYGPHIFHTGDEAVWAFVNRFARFRPYRHVVRTISRGAVYTMPINLHTINQFFRQRFSPDEARAFVAGQADRTIKSPASFEEQALMTIGRELYEAFFEGYTQKQWGCSPTELPASVLKRLPVRFDYDDSYFSHPHQGMPEDGYTAMTEAILDHPGIDVHLDRAFNPNAGGSFDHVFWSGPIDGYFGYDSGRLGYRTLTFERFSVADTHQGCAVMNYADRDVTFTRMTEHKYFSPWREVTGSVIFRETASACGPNDIPYYPIRLAREQAMLALYEEKAAKVEGVTFVGRLGTYRYMDMDQTIAASMAVARSFLSDLV
jgi:UDP-galactopyranose mutase